MFKTARSTIPTFVILEARGGLVHSVMAGLVPAIHAFLLEAKTWMLGTRPSMTTIR
jgi:hypothetical protein